MINRTLIRTKAVLALYSYHLSGAGDKLSARKQLVNSFSDAYDLYLLLLDFANALTGYADQQLQERKARAQATHTPFEANTRFIHNRFAHQVFINYRLRRELDERHLSWDAGMSAVRSIYLSMVATDWYKQYMEQEEENYDNDKRLWRRIYSELMPGNEDLQAALEEMEIELDHFTWVTDMDVVLSYVVKSVRQFREKEGPDQVLLEMFDSEDDFSFGSGLLDIAVNNYEEYDKLINAHLKDWEPDRVALMDRTILQVALAEIIGFPDIALQISLNEYIEIAKEYSGEKNYFFINGILDEIVRQLKREDKLLKAVTVD